MVHDVLFNVFPANRCRALVAVAVVGLSLGRADAQSYTYPSFDLTVSDSTAFVDLNTVGVPPAVGYSTVTITADWSAFSGDPWSNQARAVLWNMETFPPEVDYFTPIGPASSGSAGNGSSTTLTWIGYLEPGFFPGAGLYFGARQTSPGSTAQWNNITVALSNLVGLPPNHEVAVIGESVSFHLAPKMAKWYKYTIDTDGRYIFDTGGSSISEKPKIGLYNADGHRIARTSDNLNVLDLTLTPGDYFLVAAGNYMASFFEDGFGVLTEWSSATGTFVINSHAIPVPEPASAATLGLAALALLRRAPRRGIASALP